MASKRGTALATLALLGANVQAVPFRRDACPPFDKGTFSVEQYQLYPENADWDTENCLVYFGALFNSSVAVYDPYEDTMVDILTFDGITHNPALHVGGVAIDPYSGLLTIVVDAANPFNTGGQDLSGDNFIMKYDTSTKELLWKLNITEVSQGRYSGFQDVETDSRGNTYIVGTFPSTIMRVDAEGTAVELWYQVNNVTASTAGFSGLAATGDILLSNDQGSGVLYRFDMTAEQGIPTAVSLTPNQTISGSDAIYLPPKYGGKVLLAAVDASRIAVLRSQDGTWETAEYLGLVAQDSSAASGAFVTAAVQIGDNLYMVEEYFTDSIVAGTTAGNRASFPLVDITAEVSSLLGE